MPASAVPAPGLLSRGYSRILKSHKLQSRLQTIVGVETAAPVAALTFDDGPDPRWTPMVLDVLARLDAKATFFLLGRNVEAHPAVARRIVEEGHAIGNHTYSHPCLADCSPREVARQLAACDRAIRAATGQSPRLMRPPFGAQGVDTYLTVRALGYNVIHWSASSQDWLGDAAETLAGRVLGSLTPGGIVLMHDSWQPPPAGHATGGDPAVLADRTPTVDALLLIIEPLQRQDYRFVTMNELLTHGPARRTRWFWE